MRVKVIGIGGIGGCLLPVLLRFLHYRDQEDVWVTFVDGDHFDDRNRSRQAFDRPGNKAVVTARRYQDEFPRISIAAQPVFVTSDNIGTIIDEGDVVFLCVDNHATRKLVSDYCAELRDVVVISGGNEFFDGNAQVFWRSGGKHRTLPLANRFHLEIVNPKDRNPADMSCSERAEAGTPQLLLANNMAAACMLNAFYAWLEGYLAYDEVYFDIKTGAVRTERRPR